MNLFTSIYVKNSLFFFLKSEILPLIILLNFTIEIYYHIFLREKLVSYKNKASLKKDSA
jgi:hypothetical protein